MIARWMLAATAFSLMLYLGALALDAAMRVLRRPTRIGWSTALAASTLWPLIALLFLERPSETIAAGSVIMGAPVGIGAIVATPSIDWGRVGAVALLVVWSLASVLLLVRLLRATHALSRLPSTAHEAALDGVPVLVSHDIGPAAIGLGAPRIVVPQWITELDAPLRELVLRHELEHCRTRDPLTMWGASLAVALFPWNPALWLLARRLRLAIELDCDARTMAHAGVTHDSTVLDRYARLLMLVAQKSGGASLAPTLVRTPSQLTRRIHAMRAAPPSRPTLRVVVASLLVAASVTVACSSRVANNLAGPNRGVATVVDRDAATTGATVATTPPAEAAVDSLRQDSDRPAMIPAGFKGPAYPTSLLESKVNGGAVVAFVVRPDGRVDMSTFKVMRADNDAFVASIRAWLPDAPFQAARVKGRAVSQLVEMPFVFVAGGMVSGMVVPPSESVKTAPAGTVPSFVVTDTQKAEEASRIPPKLIVPGEALHDYQVEQPVVMAPGSRGPLYPVALREQGVEGTVLAQFIVDTEGRAEMGTFKVLKASHPEFGEAVREAISTMRFIPAKVGGKSMRQIVQQPFQFSLNR